MERTKEIEKLIADAQLAGFKILNPTAEHLILEAHEKIFTSAHIYRAVITKTDVKEYTIYNRYLGTINKSYGKYAKIDFSTAINVEFLQKTTQPAPKHEAEVIFEVNSTSNAHETAKEFKKIFDKVYDEVHKYKTIHDLKTDPLLFAEVKAGLKNFDVRLNDRGFQVGHYLHLQEYDKVNNEYTGRCVLKEVISILNGGFYGIESGYCVLGLKNVE